MTRINEPAVPSPDERTVREVAAIGAAFDDKVSKALESIEVRSTDTATDTTTVASNKQFGRDLPIAARFAASAVARCPEAYTGTGVTPDKIAATERRMLVLQAGKATLENALARVNAQIRLATADLGGYTRKVVQATEAIMEFPRENDPLKEQVAPAAKLLLGLLDSRRAKLRSKRAMSRLKKSQMRSTATENVHLKLTNKFLSGEKLRPEDLSVEPQAAPPKTARRKTTSRRMNTR